MLRSLYAGVSGSKTHQARMDVIGNNIANVNTVAYKAGRATFQEVMAQTIRSGYGPITGTASRGSINPMQVGLGTMLTNVESNFTQGNLSATGKETDLAIQGEGFFIIRDGYRQMYTRDGHFSIDAQGYMVVPSSGARVQGFSGQGGIYVPDTERSSDVVDLQFKVGEDRKWLATTNAEFQGNLSVDDTSWLTTARIYDSLGREKAFTLKFDKVSDTEWTLNVYDSEEYEADPTTATALLEDSAIEFDATGKVINVGGAAPASTAGTITWDGVDIDLDFKSLRQVADHSSVKLDNQNGYPVGVLEYIEINKNGLINGHYSNQQTLPLGQLALANFPNPWGLIKTGNNSYEATPASGERVDSLPGLDGSGTILAMQLEMSNVDLSEEFTDMIVTQRGLQANNKVITASDEILQDLMNIKR